MSEWLDWRWCMFVNVLFAGVAFAGSSALLPRVSAGPRPRLDVIGTVTVAADLFSTVYGLANAENHPWSAPVVWAFLAMGLLLLAGFVLIERWVGAPLLPLRVVLGRHRGGAFLAAFIMIIGMFSIVLFLSYVMQQRLGFSPFMDGVAFLPMIAWIRLPCAGHPVPRRARRPERTARPVRRAHSAALRRQSRL